MPAAAHALRKLRMYESPTSDCSIETPDGRVPVLCEQLRPEDRLVRHRTLREAERPLAQPVFRARDGDRRDAKALLDRLSRRDAVVGDGGPEDRQTAFVDQLAVGVDHRLRGTLRQAFDLAEDDLDGTVDDAALHTLREHHFEGTGQVETLFFGVAVGKDEIEEVAEFDGLCVALVGQCRPFAFRLVPRPRGLKQMLGIKRSTRNR